MESEIELARQTLDVIAGRKMVVQEYFLHYLMGDEQKHAKMLGQLETIKKGIYPYG